jgi:hypothetical protein
LTLNKAANTTSRLTAVPHQHGTRQRRCAITLLTNWQPDAK